MASTTEILEALGTGGLGSQAAHSASVRTSALASGVGQWAASLATQIEAEVGQLDQIHDESHRFSAENWQSPAAEAYRCLLEGERAANRAFRFQLSEAAQSTRAAGANLTATLEALAASLGGLGSLLDTALSSMGRIDEVLDDVVLYAERAGLPGLQAELAGQLQNPLLQRVADTLTRVGR